MKLTTKTRYGLRALLNLASRKSPVLLKEIAKREEISIKYLQHLFHSLKVAGIVKSERGVNGGFSLLRDPAKIKISEIVPVLEGSLSLVECVNNEKVCQRVASCATRDLWKELHQAIMKVLAAKTLGDLTKIKEEKESKESLTYCI